MTSLAKQLIEEHFKTQNPTLDLGYCGLDGTELELSFLIKCYRLKTLILSDKWEEYEHTQQSYIDKRSQNVAIGLNNLKRFPTHLPRNLEKLVAAGELFNNWAIEDIAPLERLTALQQLNLAFNKIHDISFLANLKNLRSLNLRFNPIHDFSFLTQLPHLEILHIGVNSWMNLSFLWELKQLKELHLGANPVYNLAILKDLKQLEILRINLNALAYPPIWYAYLHWQKGKLGDYQELTEVPYADKIWQLLNSRDAKNITLARQLALGQGWKEDDFEAYLSLLDL